MKTKNFYFNEETIKYFKSMKSNDNVKQEIYEFVVNNCELEDDETYEDLSESLCRQVF